MNRVPLRSDCTVGRVRKPEGPTTHRREEGRGYKRWFPKDTRGLLGSSVLHPGETLRKWEEDHVDSEGKSPDGP